MKVADFAADALSHMSDRLIAGLDGLSVEQQRYRPDPDPNTIAWLAWHLTRVQDHHIADLGGGNQLWIDDGWGKKLGMSSDLEDHGYGHTSEQVGALVPPNATVLAEYQAPVAQRTDTYVRGLTEEQFDEIIDRAWDPPVTRGVRLTSVVNETAQHVGQISYLRGLVERRR